MRQPSSSHAGEHPIAVSIGILAWNEEDSIGPTLESLFGQSLFRELAARGERCEIICLANACTDRTVPLTRALFERMTRDHPDRAGFVARVEDIPEPGRNNAWNRFVHEFSAPETRFIAVMDADIIFNRPDTFELVLGELESNSHLGGASDWPVKNISLKSQPSLRERLSLATSDMTGNIAGRLNGMLYCLRTAVARNLYLPRDLGANDDGFFKAAICTDFFRAPVDATRVVSVRAATHLYQPYLALGDVINNQKRQMIGQTAVYVLVEYLKTLPVAERAQLARTLQHFETTDPDWLKRLIQAHLARTSHFWQLFPDLLSFRWKRWTELRGMQRVTHFPAAAAGFCLTLIASWHAARFLRRGVAAYWPKTQRETILPTPASVSSTK